MAIESAGAPPESEQERNRRLVADRFAAWRTGTGNPYELLADDVSWTILGSTVVAGTYAGREAFTSRVLKRFNARLNAPLVSTLRQIHADGKAVVVLFEVAGTARDGQPFANSLAWFLEMEEGRIVRVNALFDSLAFDALWHRVPETV